MYPEVINVHFPRSPPWKKTRDSVRTTWRNGAIAINESRITPKRKTQISTAPAASSQSVQQRQIEERSELTQAIQRSPDWSNGSLQPAGLFSRAATRGSFSLGSILNASQSTTSEAQHEESRIPADDPIQLGLLNSSIASSLFEK